MKILLLSILAAGFVIVAKPQPPGQPPKPPSPEERIRHTTEILQKEITLTPAQKAAVEAAFKQFFTAADKIRKENPPPPPPPPDPKVKEAMDKLVADRDASVKKILTAQQYEQYREALKKLHPKGPGGQQGHPPPPARQ